MHPIKSRLSIRLAYFDYGVRDFALDSLDELHKILNETKHAKDLTLHVRLAMPSIYAKHDLSEKFGVHVNHAADFLKIVDGHACKVGLCFHVGSQCMHPDAYRSAIRMTSEVMKDSGVTLDFLNVGGGFPSIYSGMTPPPLIDYFNAIHAEFDALPESSQITLLSEPGRAIVAESSSLIVRVEARKGETLYINDGLYGGLFDASILNLIHPVRRLFDTVGHHAAIAAFSFYGPTCDSLDFIRGPFYLSDNIQEGDLIEIGQVGAYSKNLASSFNGFTHYPKILMISDLPILTMYPSMKGKTSKLLPIKMEEFDHADVI